MKHYRFEHGNVSMVSAWTREEVHEGVAALLVAYTERLPTKRDARIVLKPNLNNDLVALTGNSVDLRVLAAILEWLQAAGYTDITIADGSNIGIERRGIDTFARLRIDRLAERYGVGLVNLNQDEGYQVVLTAGAHPQIARTVIDCDFLISIPKVKTHCEATLSCAMKNWVGIARGQDKRHMHMDLGRNIFAINEVIRPDLILVDGLIGMEGNGPGDGEPYRLGRLMMSDSAFVNDVVIARMIGLKVEEIPYLVYALESGDIDQELIDAVNATVEVIRRVKKAPPRSKLAELSDSRKLLWLKKAVRPLTSQESVLKVAYKLNIVQDVYSFEEDEVEGVKRSREDCGPCTKCADFCPTGLSVDEIGVKTDPESCISCMYCWWVCPDDAIQIAGNPGYMERQIERYKKDIEGL
ncbi:MAG: hypothetical protein ACI8RZ_006785 [Myxococcota bacterium]|jgi:uncharacterized protein (DUF362 family)/ferredoxin